MRWKKKLLTEKSKAESSHIVFINADEKVTELGWFSPTTTRPSVSKKNSNAMRIPFIYR
jgi:hypothetical protein